MQHHDRGGVQEVERKVAVGGDVHAVGGDAVKSQVLRDGLAIEGESAAGQRARAQRQYVGSATGLSKALPIAGQHLKIGQQVMRP